MNSNGIYCHFLHKSPYILDWIITRGTTHIIFIIRLASWYVQVKSSLYFASLAPGLSLVSIASIIEKYPSAIASRVSDSHFEKSFQSILGEVSEIRKLWLLLSIRTVRHTSYHSWLFFEHIVICCCSYPVDWLSHSTYIAYVLWLFRATLEVLIYSLLPLREWVG